jgi:transcriptional regulator
MYRPEHFSEDRIEVLHATMKEIGAGAVVGSGRDGLMATHVPIELDADPAPWGTIRCHFARANPHVDAIVEGEELLVLFQGPQAYVTPSWYPTKEESGGRVVPT